MCVCVCQQHERVPSSDKGCRTPGLKRRSASATSPVNVPQKLFSLSNSISFTSHHSSPHISRDDETQWEAVVRREGLSVHAVREKDVVQWVQRHRQRDTPQSKIQPKNFSFSLSLSLSLVSFPLILVVPFTVTLRKCVLTWFRNVPQAARQRLRSRRTWPRTSSGSVRARIAEVLRSSARYPRLLVPS